MTFLQPLGLSVLLLIPLIVLLHMLRVRRQQLNVSTIHFWAEAMRDTREQPRLQRPPLTLLLLLQLLLVALVAFGLSRPSLKGLFGNEYESSHTIVVLDASASMQATDVAPNRFEAARARADDLLAGLDPGVSVTLVRMGAAPEILYTGDDSGLARAALRLAQSGGASANLRETMRLTSSIVKPGMTNRIVVFSDLSYAPDQHDLQALGQLPASVDFIPFGGAIPNRAITLLAARALPGSTNRFQVLARVANFSGDPASPVARVIVDGLTIEPRQLRLTAGSQVDLRWDLPPGASRVEVHITGEDALPADDVAQLILPNPTARRLLVVSQQPDTLARALAAIPGAEVQVVAPDNYQPDPAAAITVFENFLPSQLPGGGVILVKPPADNPLFPSEGQSTDTAITRLRANSSLLDAVDLSSITIGTTQRFPAPTWANEIVGSNSGPLLFEGVYQNTPMVVLNFGLTESNLPSRVGFPILMSNIVDHLAPDYVPPTVEPGQPISLRVGPLVNSVTIQRPSGSAERFSGGDLVTFADTEEWGRYVISEAPANGGPARERFFTVNAGSDTESDLGSPQQPSIAAAPPGQIAGGPTHGREIWPLLSLLALVILLVEWWVAQR